MDSYIGIIAAEDKEMQAIKEIMENIEEIKIYNLSIYKGTINNKNYLLTKCGIGKVNAARTTQILIDKFNIDHIINLGSAGALNDKLKIGDIVVGEKLIQHDFDVTPFGYEKGYIPGTGMVFESGKTLIDKCKEVKIDDVNIVSGTIASGDIFLNNVQMKEKIKSKFNADCAEMEGASVAQVCNLNNIPFVVIRSISDIPNGNNEMDFEKYLDFASKNCAKFIAKI